MAALTRVLKGCMKAADWGMRDSMGGWAQMSIKSQSEKIRERLQHSWTPTHKCTKNKIGHRVQ